MSLTNAQQRAAEMVALDTLSDQQIADKIGVTKRSIEYWKRRPEFAAAVSEVVESLRATIRAEGIANKQNRIDAYNDRWQRLQTVIEERAADPEIEDVPGGTTGLLVRQVKQVGAGKSAQIIEEYAVDTGLLSEMRQHEKQAAVELSQWTERKELSSDPDKPLRILVQYDDADSPLAPPAP